MISEALTQLGIDSNANVHSTVRSIRERITRSDDPDQQFQEATNILGLFNVSLPIEIDVNEARLLATAIVSEAMQNRDGDLFEIIDRSKERVDNIKSMGLKPTPVKKSTESLKTQKTRRTRSKIDLTMAIEIFSKDTNRRVYDIVTDVATAYNVDRAKAYSIMAKARKYVNG